MKRVRYFILTAVMLLLASLTLVACDGEKTTVRLDANGGTCSVQTLAAQVGKKLPPLPEAERDGYVFTGWYTSADTADRWSVDTDRVKDKEGLTLYAGWKPLSSDFVAVTYDVGGGSGALSEREVRQGNMLPKPSDPVRDGYRFDGWYKQAECLDAWDFSTDTVTAATTLYAKWTKMHTVTVIIDGERAENVYEDGDSLNISLGIKDGYVFGGMYKDASFKNEVKNNTPVTSDMTLYMQFIKATAPEMFEYEEQWDIIRITAIKDEFDGDELVIPEAINGKSVTDIYFNGELPSTLKKVYIPSSVTSLDSYVLDRCEVVFSPANRYYTVYDDCLYQRNGNGWTLSSVPQNKRIINVMANATVNTYLDPDKILVLSDDVSVHENDNVSYNSFKIIVPEQYYAGYAELFGERVFSDKDFKGDKLIRGGALYVYVGGDTAEVGVDDGVTEIKDGALHGVHNVTFGKNIARIEGRLFGYSYDASVAHHYVYKFLGDVPEITVGTWEIFPSVGEDDTRKIYVGKDYAVNYHDRWQLDYADMELLEGDDVLVDGEGRLIRWFGGDTAVVGKDGDGITIIGDGSLYGVSDVTFGKNIDTIEGSSLYGGWNVNPDEEIRLKYTFVGDMPLASNGYYSLFRIPQNEGDSLKIWLPVDKAGEYRSDLWAVWKYVKFDTEEKFIIDGDRILKYTGDEKTIHLPKDVTFDDRTFERDIEAFYPAKPTAEGSSMSYSYTSELNSLDVYIPNTAFDQGGGQIQICYFEFYVNFVNSDGSQKRGTVNLHVDASDTTATAYYTDWARMKNEENKFITYNVVKWEVTPNA